MGAGVSVPALTGTLTLTAARQRAALVLDEVTPVIAGYLTKDLVVLPDVVDSLDPPALMLGWLEDPWLEPAGPCRFNATLTVMCVASRMDPAPAVEDLEALVSHVVGTLQADAYSWGLANVQAPRAQPIGNVNYLASRVTYRVPVAPIPPA